MKLRGNNFAYIDGANLHKGIKNLGWKLDYARFRIWLTEKYEISKAYIFVGFVPVNQDIYDYVKQSGFDLIYKEVTFDKDGKTKGNCDVDLVLEVVCGMYEGKYDKAIIVSSDGDYSRLVKFLSVHGKLEVVLSPYKKELCSLLLKQTNVSMAYLGDQKLVLELGKNKKAPDGDKTP